MNELRKREDCPAGYYYATIGNNEWSVVDFGTTVVSIPKLEEMRKAGLFLGWEAILVGNDGKLNSDKMFRAHCWADLKEQL